MATKKILTLSSIVLIAFAIIAIGVVASETGYITLSKSSTNANLIAKPICSDADRDKSSSCEGYKKPQLNCRWSVGCDCDDTRANVHFGLEEVCDGLDNNCDRLIDNACKGQDLDKDGYARLIPWGRCNADAACAIRVYDCNDNNPNINPGMSSDVCGDTNGIDDNCDGQIDEACARGQVCIGGGEVSPNGSISSPHCA